MIAVGIVADDLTGANATGALLAGQGLRVATCLGLGEWDEARLARFDVLSVSTDSRLIPKDQAFKRVHDVMREFTRMRPKYYAKRIDSTLRGNLGAEIEAALTALGSDALAVVVPAFPASGRHAVGGYVLVNGLALEQTAVARDPANPVHTSRYVEVIAKQTDLPIGWIDLSTVLLGVDATRAAVLDWYARGVRIVATDAVSDQDIACVAESLKNLAFPVVSVDPGPFTAAVGKAFGVGQGEARPLEIEDSVLVIIGSASDLTRKQIETLRASQPVSLFKVDCSRLAGPEAERLDEIDRAVARLKAAADQTGVLGVCTVEREEDVCSLPDLAKCNGVAMHETSERINSGLAEIAARMLAAPEARIGGVYTSGGEVTLAVAKRLGAIGFSVRDEVLPLAVYGHLVGGACDDLPIVTKGGLVGDASGLVTCVNYLRTKVSTRVRA